MKAWKVGDSNFTSFSPRPKTVIYPIVKAPMDYDDLSESGGRP